MRGAIATFILSLSCITFVFAQNGTISVKSAYDVRTTADRLEQELHKKGMTIFTRINHAEDAEKVGKQLPPTELIIFGNPNVGTPLMQCSQSIAIDLPQKALIWKSKDGQVWYTYNDPGYLAKRHHLSDCKEILRNISGSLDRLAHIATAP
jgi:uncharacterized protein (DUF302 family)